MPEYLFASSTQQSVKGQAHADGEQAPLSVVPSNISILDQPDNSHIVDDAPAMKKATRFWKSIKMYEWCQTNRREYC